MFYRSLDIWGCYFRIVSNDALVLEGATQSLGPFFCAEAEDPVDLYIISVDGGHMPLTIPESARRVQSGDGAILFLYNQFWLMDFHGKARLAVHREKGTAWGFIQRRYVEEGSWLLGALSQPVSDYLGKRGLYMLHSGAVSLAGKGVLLAGESKSGKTTSALRLVGAGFGFLSDDRCFLRRSGCGFEVLSFPEPVTVYPPNVADLPEFQFLQGDGHDDIGRKSFGIEEVYPHSVVNRAELKAILFPCWYVAGESRLEMVSPGRAVREIFPLTISSLFPDSERAHFEFIADLVEKVPAYRLYLGGDKEKWPQLVKGLLQ